MMRSALYGLILSGLLHPEPIRLKATLWEAGPNGRQVVSRAQLQTFAGEAAWMRVGEWANVADAGESRFAAGVANGYEFRITPLASTALHCTGIWQEAGSPELRRGQIIEATGKPGAALELPCRQGPDGADAWLEVRIVAD